MSDGYITITALGNMMQHLADQGKIPLYVGIGVTTLTGLVLARRYFLGAVCYSSATLNGKTAIVTGANCGLGFETAKDLARRGATVILACRDWKAGQKAAADIVYATKNQNVLVKILDLARLSTVRQFAEDVNRSCERVDILVNNAGVMACPKNTTEDGFEYQLGVNHLGHFLLTNLLLEKIKASSPSRIVNVSSKAGIRPMAEIRLDDLHLDREYHPWKAYAQSKLANILFTRELAKRLKGTGVTANCCHPGVVTTNLGRHMQFPLWKRVLLGPLILFLFKTPWYGAQTQIFLSVAPEVHTVSGFYFADCRADHKLPQKCLDDETARKLWEISEQLTADKN